MRSKATASEEKSPVAELHSVSAHGTHSTSAVLAGHFPQAFATVSVPLVKVVVVVVQDPM